MGKTVRHFDKTVRYLSWTVQYMGKVVRYLSWSVQYMGKVVRYLSWTVQYMGKVVRYLSWTVQYGTVLGHLSGTLAVTLTKLTGSWARLPVTGIWTGTWLGLPRTGTWITLEYRYLKQLVIIPTVANSNKKNVKEKRKLSQVLVANVHIIAALLKSTYKYKPKVQYLSKLHVTTAVPLFT
jgi:hypothetical protein